MTSFKHLLDMQLTRSNSFRVMLEKECKQKNKFKASHRFFLRVLFRNQVQQDPIVLAFALR